MDIVIEQLTHLRVSLDAIFKSLEEDGDQFPAQLSTKLAFMWLGKAKGIAGSANPYPTSADPSSKTIEAAVDQYEGDLVSNTDDIAFIKTLRKELDTVENQIRNGLMPYMIANRFYQQALTNSWSHLCEAKMFLGLALGEIRDSQDKPSDVMEGKQENQTLPVPKSVMETAEEKPESKDGLAPPLESPEPVPPTSDLLHAEGTQEPMPPVGDPVGQDGTSGEIPASTEPTPTQEETPTPEAPKE